MKIRNLRWGYDGGGMACGPVDSLSLIQGWMYTSALAFLLFLYLMF